jgi:hypothetical protein
MTVSGASVFPGYAKTRNHRKSIYRTITAARSS